MHFRLQQDLVVALTNILFALFIWSLPPQSDIKFRTCCSFPDGCVPHMLQCCESFIVWKCLDEVESRNQTSLPWCACYSSRSVCSCCLCLWSDIELCVCVGGWGMYMCACMCASMCAHACVCVCVRVSVCVCVCVWWLVLWKWDQRQFTNVSRRSWTLK